MRERYVYGKSYNGRWRGLTNLIGRMATIRHLRISPPRYVRPLLFPYELTHVPPTILGPLRHTAAATRSTAPVRWNRVRPCRTLAHGCWGLEVNVNACTIQPHDGGGCSVAVDCV